MVGVAAGSVGGSGAIGAPQGALAAAATSTTDSTPHPVAFRQNKRPRLEVWLTARRASQQLQLSPCFGLRCIGLYVHRLQMRLALRWREAGVDGARRLQSTCSGLENPVGQPRLGPTANP